LSPAFDKGEAGFSMFAASAETQPFTLEQAPTPPERPLVMRVSEIVDNELVHMHTKRMMRAAGRLALGHTVEAPNAILNPRYNLHQAIQRAAAGDAEAILFVDANCETDAIERTLKAGHDTKVILAENDRGEIMQHGQTTEDIQINNFGASGNNFHMFGRSKAEANNSVRHSILNRLGLLNDFYCVTWSGTDDKMNLAELSEANFFTDTMSGAFQALTKENGQLTLESAFVAGIKAEGEDRHDQHTIVEMAAGLKVDCSGMSTTEIIDDPWLIHKSLMPNGLIDLVKRFDDAAGGTFFGQAKPRQDYVAYRDACRQREKAYQPIAVKIRNALIAEADQIKTPVEATARLDALSQKFTLQMAIEDKTIDSRVFGPAAPHIEQARVYLETGQRELAFQSTEKAQAVAKSSSCPKWKQAADGLVAGQTDSESSNATTGESTSNEIRCVQCREQVKKADVVKADCWECPKCKHKVDICTGEVLNVGKIEPAKDTSLSATIIDFIAARRAREQSLALVA
jgi:hypothetical protein